MEEWAKQSAVTLTKAIRDKKISSSELLDYFIERYERLNPKINAIVATNFDDARKKAAEADKALSKGKVLGPLHGLPMTLKDNLEIIGMHTTYGHPLFADHMPEENADVVQSVIDAGAVIFGKTNMPQGGMDTQTFNKLFGQTNNPWDASRTPGGSSGGSAAALAAGLTGLEIGNDSGGSIRLPAHFCGVYGHKPSYNIVSMHGANKPWSFKTRFPADSDLFVNGPLARSAEDLLLAMEIIVGPPSYQRKAFKINLPEPRKKVLSDFKVGVWIDDPLCPPDNDVGDVLSDFVDRLSRTGVTLVNKKPDIDLKTIQYLRNLLEVASSSLFQPPELYQGAVDILKSGRKNIRPWVKGMTMEHREWNFLSQIRSFFQQKCFEYFKEVDIMLCPVTRIAAPPHDHTLMAERTVQFNEEILDYVDVIIPWISLSSVAYIPATVVPAGTTPGGLPVGIQIVGPYLEDLTTIQFAIHLEKEIIGPYQLPPGYDH